MWTRTRVCYCLTAVLVTCLHNDQDFVNTHSIADLPLCVCVRCRQQTSASEQWWCCCCSGGG